MIEYLIKAKMKLSCYVFGAQDIQPYF